MGSIPASGDQPRGGEGPGPGPSALEEARRSLASGGCVAILDAEAREGETDLFFPAESLQPADLRFLRMQAGGELYISVGHEVAALFGLPYVGSVLELEEAKKSFPVLGYLGKGVGGMCQGSCSVGVSLDHRSTHTGAPDLERSFTCRRLAELSRELNAAAAAASIVGTTKNGQVSAARRLGEEFHSPGHIFLCMENSKGLEARRGHTELSIALARHASIQPLMVGCVMLNNEGDDFGALPPERARAWARRNGVPFLAGEDILQLHPQSEANSSRP